MRIVFEIAGDKLIERELLRVGEHAGDASPAFSAIADLMMAETREQFATQGQHASGGWKPLKPATLAAKRRKHQRTEILRADDRLLHSLTQRGDTNQLLEVRRDELVYGSKLAYAGAHQNPRAGSHLPQRRPVAFTEGAKREIVRVLQRWLLTGELA